MPEPDEIRIEQEDPRQDDIRNFVRDLNAFDEALYPPEANYHMSVEELYSPDIIFLVARQGHQAVGMGALWLRKDWAIGEVKRMFVSPKARGRGVAQRLLGRIEDLAHAHKIPRLMLETGPKNSDALRLYERAGFTVRGPFANYPETPFSVFMEKRLA